MRIFVGKVVDQFTLAVRGLLHKLYIGALPVGLKGKIGGKFFRIEVQYKLDGAAVIQFNGDKNKDFDSPGYDPNKDAKMFLVTEIDGYNTEDAVRKIQSYVGKEGYDKDIKRFVDNLAKEVRDFNRGKVKAPKRERKEKAPEVYYLTKVEGRNSLMWVPGSRIKRRKRDIPNDVFPDRFIAFSQVGEREPSVFDKKTGVRVLNWGFDFDDTVQRLNALKKQDDPDGFIQRFADKLISEQRELAKKLEEPWYEKPGSAPVMKPQLETVRKEAKVIPIKPEKKVEMKKEKSPSVETYFIEYLNKDKGFKKDIKRFGSYDEAKNWMRRNFEKVDLDMIKIETKEKSPSVETYRQTGSSSRKYDERLDAMKPGKRRSASGSTYYEYRKNRSDKPGGKI